VNLTTEPWIPMVCSDGRHDCVSLRDAFLRGHEICDLAVRPHERVALMRLLLCVTQAALDGPDDYGDLLACADRIAPTAQDYLTKWQAAFELFGDQQRFLQVADLKPVKAGDDGEGNSVSKLDIALATGNNTTLFDNAGGMDREFTPARLALALLTFQCFSPGGRIGVARWNRTLTAGKGSSDHAPCLPGSMMHGVLRGSNLLDTVHLNLLSKDMVKLFVPHGAWGRPTWEQNPASPSDVVAVENATQTYLGRLVPLTRAVRLDQGKDTMTLANGLDYPAFPDWREPTATIVIRQRNNQRERKVLNASLDKAPWRELHALAVKRIGQDTNGGVVALQNLTGDRPFDLWVGGLVADKAKPLDTVEAVYHVPAGMLTEPCQRAYEQGVDYAEKMSWRLGAAVVTYFKELGDDIGRPDARKRRQQIQRKAAAQYWTDIEREVGRLLSSVEQLSLNWGETGWGLGVRGAARRAIDAACPHETPRQMRAYALALQTLTRPPREDSNEKPEEDPSHE
jgi:CRISPR system Cascade subunit CasA